MAYYHCLLFDVDGTLLDFSASEQAALKETFEHYGFERKKEMQARYAEINASLIIKSPLPKATGFLFQI